MMTTYLEHGTTQTPARGRGQRKSKKNERYCETSDDNDNDEEPVSFQAYAIYGSGII